MPADPYHPAAPFDDSLWGGHNTIGSGSMENAEPVPLILFSGLAAGPEVFEQQLRTFPQLLVPAWPKPEAGDTLESYCRRLADDLRPHGPAVLGGASFGGVIALHVAKHLRPRAVVLIGSVRSPAELPRRVRYCRPLKWLVPLLPVRMAQNLFAPVIPAMLGCRSSHLPALVRQFRNSDPAVFRWSLARLLDWNEAPRLDCPVFHVHGERDMILPCRNTRPDCVIAGGGHVISLTHSGEVDEFIRSVLEPER